MSKQATTKFAALAALGTGVAAFAFAATATAGTKSDAQPQRPVATVEMAGTGAGHWVHPTGPTGAIHAEFVDDQGKVLYLLEAMLTKYEDYPSLDVAQFGYMDGNLYRVPSAVGPIELFARVEGLWEMGAGGPGRFLSAAIEPDGGPKSKLIGLIEGDFSLAVKGAKEKPTKDKGAGLAKKPAPLRPAGSAVSQTRGATSQGGQLVPNPNDIAVDRAEGPVRLRWELHLPIDG